MPREVLYDADGNETADETLAVRGVLLDDDGEVLEEWQVDLGPGDTMGIWDPPPAPRRTRPDESP
jgi:hypothetical protein